MKNLHNFYIDGQWVEPQNAAHIDILNPATDEACLSMACATPQDVDTAVMAARAAFGSWSQTPQSERAALMRKAADEMEKRTDDLIDAHVMCMGVPRHQTMDYHVGGSIDGLRYYADMCEKLEGPQMGDGMMIVKEPIGVCALINPWNYPLYQLIGKIAPALAAGCTVVAKPSEQTPLCDIIMAEIFDKVGLPAGVFNVIMGIGRDMGGALCSHPEVDMVSFTGSVTAGVKVAEAAAPTVKRVCQELGGKSPLIITEDADLEAAVTYGVDHIMMMAGQSCDALSRMLVPRSRYEEAVNLAKKVAEKHKVGDPLDPETTIGPLAFAAHRDRVLPLIHKGIEEGARLITGGPERPEGLPKGAYVKPTIFADVTPDMTIAREEIFGPVLCMMAYDTVEDAIAIANDTVFGLASAVYAKDKASALPIALQLRTGQCYIQGGSYTLDAPFGGYKQSGNGREWGEDGLAEYQEIKAIMGA